MPYELRGLAPAIDYVEHNLDAGFAMLRSLRAGERPGFAAIVDRLDPVEALMLVERPDWRGSADVVTQIRMDASATRPAAHLLSWIPRVARVRLYTYRPWLFELVQSSLESLRLEQKVHCTVDRQRFRPSSLQPLVIEIGPGQTELRGQARAMGLRHDGDRLFGVVQGEGLVACATLGRPEADYVEVQSVFTRESDRLRGYGSAVLSAATQAGLDTGRTVTYGLPVTDIPALHLVAGLGFTPVCREWMVEGYPKH